MLVSAGALARRGSLSGELGQVSWEKMSRVLKYREEFAGQKASQQQGWQPPRDRDVNDLMAFVLRPASPSHESKPELSNGYVMCAGLLCSDVYSINCLLLQPIQHFLCSCQCCHHSSYPSGNFFKVSVLRPEPPSHKYLIFLVVDLFQ